MNVDSSSECKVIFAKILTPKSVTVRYGKVRARAKLARLFSANQRLVALVVAVNGRASSVYCTCSQFLFDWMSKHI